MKKQIPFYKWVVLIFLMITSSISQATTNAVGLGDLANNMLSPISILRHVFTAISFVLGVYMVTNAIMKYLRFRQNPQESPISTVIFMAILGALLIFIPFLHHITIWLAQKEGIGDVI